MPPKIRCPDCKIYVKLPSKNATVRCPECSRKLSAAGPSDRANRDDLPRKKKKKKKPGLLGNPRLLWSIVGGVGGAFLLAAVVVGIVLLVRAERRVTVVAKDGPKDARPDDGNRPIVPWQPPEEGPPPPAMWKAKPDPLTKVRETLPDSMRWPLGFAEPLFASADGPFMVDMPHSHVNGRSKDKLIDLRTGKEMGSFSIKSPIYSTGGHLRLSPDGQHVAGYSGKSIDVWKVGAEEATSKLTINSPTFWLDFRTADEVVAVTIDNKTPMVLVWKIADGKKLHSISLPRNTAFERGAVGTNAAISPGRKQIAVATQGEVYQR